MSADIYATMTTDELIQRFANTAKRVGSGWTGTFLRPESERKAQVRELQAMGAELRARKPIASYGAYSKTRIATSADARVPSSTASIPNGQRQRPPASLTKSP